ncbi:MAG: hypothetical protein RL145_1453, partial [Pseudomonadota bacterium]
MRSTQTVKLLLAAASSLMLSVATLPSVALAQAAITKPAGHNTTTQ